MAQRRRNDDVLPAPPDAPVPPAGEPDTASSDAERRHHRISEAAYYRAERRGFAPGAEQEDWFEAERDIDHGKVIDKKPEANDFPTPK